MLLGPWLVAGRAAVAAGERSGAAVGRAMRAVVAGEPLVELDYAVAVDAASLDEADAIDDPATVRLLVAAQVGPGPADRQQRRPRTAPTTPPQHTR